MFCDLRGFSRHSEQSAEDLLGLLNRVSQALGVTTHQIREQGGVLGDFHGDAAMGFWGWPLPQPDAAVRACLAALAIRAEFAETASRRDDPLADFRVGIGIATGRAVAGKIGTVDQVKVTVFGPVVNLASRLEGMTKILHAPILIDERTAIVVRNQLSPTAGAAATRGGRQAVWPRPAAGSHRAVAAGRRTIPALTRSEHRRLRTRRSTTWWPDAGRRPSSGCTACRPTIGSRTF